MKVVIFGGSGFVGSHLADALLKKKYDVTVFDLKPSSYLKPPGRMVIGDILDEKAVQDAVKDADFVYNVAGVADIDEAKVNPIKTIKQNVLGNTMLLEACRKNKVKRFLFASSIYVYSNSGSFYRSSKHACELIIEDYKKIYGLDFTIMRYGSLYGPRSDEKNWIYRMLKEALTKGKITRKGDGEEIRDYIHVHDAAEASVELLGKQYANEYVIISGSQTIKIKDLLTMVKEMMGGKVDVKYVSPAYDEHYEVTPYSFNPRIAKKVVGNSYLDLGQGMLDMLERVYKEVSHKKEQNGVYFQK